MMAPTDTPKRLTAAVLSIGDELILGQTLDTNAAWLADRLTALGVVVIEHATVADDLPALTATFRRLAAAADVVVSTGGLGPTKDDLTRDALAALLGEQLIEDPGALETLRGWYAKRGRMPETNRVQAMRPPSARMLSNPNGTAPGLAATLAGGTRISCLPGPPHEMRPMFEADVGPQLGKASGVSIRSRLLLTFGLGESAVAELLGPLMDRDREARGLPAVGTTASRGVVTVRIRQQSGDPAEADRALDDAEREIRDRLGPIVFDRRDPARGDSIDVRLGLAEYAVRRLAEAGERLVVAESCTGGGLGAEVTAIPGSSAVFMGGWQTYSNEAKTGMLGVPEEIFADHGAVSRECAEAMASGALRRAHELGLEATHALSLTGVAGPDGGSEHRPVGTVWIGRADHDGVEARQFLFRGGRQAVREWSTRAALGMLRLRLDREQMRLLGQIG
jgi:nicotinamide-nucleotide amidase